MKLIKVAGAFFACLDCSTVFGRVQFVNFALRPLVQWWIPGAEAGFALVSVPIAFLGFILKYTEELFGWHARIIGFAEYQRGPDVQPMLDTFPSFLVGR